MPTIPTNFHRISNGDKASFLNSLADKLAAGPPKKPVGLLKKPTIGAGEEAPNPVAPSEAQQKLANIMKQAEPTNEEK